MLYQTFNPPLNLAPYVRFFWVLEADVLPGEEFIHRSMADGCVEIVFHYKTQFDEIGDAGRIETSPIATINAQSTRFRRYSARASFGIFGAYLYPFAIPRLFSFPASDFTNIAPDLESVFGMDGKRLEELVCSAAGHEQRVKVVSEFLQQKLDAAKRELPLVYRAVHSILDADGNVNISAMARYHALSTRQFERKFKELAGLPPKLYSRIVRFQAATRYKFDGERDLTEIAYACGYYDQSHFINDFREFSGYTPKEYFWNQAEGTQYMNA
ncbi:MAG TPA: helix-turn-helix transcriptional regulator [Pyrinomonadaceae bacterium]|nr:helix-turn-helix transcriptional regulator [Pyrinomonadaceae bacterium]